MLAPCYDYSLVTLRLYDHLVFDLCITLCFDQYILSLCMIWPLCSLSWSHPSLFASLHLYCFTNASNHQKPSFPAVSTISTYLWYFIATPLWFVHVLPLKPSKYYHLFCETSSSW